MDDDGVSLKSLFVPLTGLKVFFVLLAIGFIVYFNALFNFFAWDDFPYVFNNPEIHKFDIVHFFGPNTFNSGNSGFYRPVAMAYLSFLYNIFGTNAFLYHFLQVFQHVTASFLLFILFKKIFKVGISFYLAILFLVHPIQVESVAYMGGLASGVVFLCGITAILIAFKDRLSYMHTFLIYFLITFGLLFKEPAILFIPLIIFVSVCFKKRTLLSSIHYAVVPIFIYFFIRIVNVGVDLSQLHRATLVPIQELGFLERMQSVPAIVFFYIKTLLFPKVLAFDQMWIIEKISFTSFYLPLLIDILVLVAMLYVGYRAKKVGKKLFLTYLFFFVWFVGNFGILLQIVPLDMTVADRWMYVPLAGLLGIIGVGIKTCSLFERRSSALVYTLLVAIVLLLSIRTIVRNKDWKDDLTLLTHDSKVLTNFDIENNLGSELASRGRYDEALPHLENSLRLKGHDTSYYNIAHVYEQVGKYDQAKKYYRIAINTNRNIKRREAIIKNAYAGLGRVLLLHDTPGNAAVFLKEAMKVYPDDPMYISYYALALYKLDRYDESLIAAKKAYSMRQNETTKAMYDKIVNKEVINLR